MKAKTLTVVAKRNFFWGSNKQAKNLFSSDEELKMMQYRGRVDGFADNAINFERYLRDMPPLDTLVQKNFIPGKCTQEATALFKEHAVKTGVPAKNFRKPFPLPIGKSEITFDLSTVGLGTYLGQPDDQDDFDIYVAMTSLVRSGTLNFIDTAPNYRCQKSERIVGAALRSLLDEDLFKHDSA